MREAYGRWQSIIDSYAECHIIELARRRSSSARY